MHLLVVLYWRTIDVWFRKVLGVNILTERTPAAVSLEVTATVTIVPREVDVSMAGVNVMVVLDNPRAVRTS